MSERPGPVDSSKIGGPKVWIVNVVIVDCLSQLALSQDCCQDWMWQTRNEREIRMRSRQLAR